MGKRVNHPLDLDSLEPNVVLEGQWAPTSSRAVQKVVSNMMSAQIEG